MLHPYCQHIYSRQESQQWTLFGFCLHSPPCIFPKANPKFKFEIGVAWRSLRMIDETSWSALSTKKRWTFLPPNFFICFKTFQIWYYIILYNQVKCDSAHLYSFLLYPFEMYWRWDVAICAPIHCCLGANQNWAAPIRSDQNEYIAQIRINWIRCIYIWIKEKIVLIQITW